MLHPAIEVRSIGTIHDNGLFATRLITKGTTIWTLVDKTYSWKEIETWSPERYRDFRWYGFQCGVDRYSLPESTSREMNHSCDPNTWSRFSDFLIARRDIQANEEVTYDYSTGDIDIEFEIECHCGASICRNTISNRDYLDPDWQNQYGLNLPSYVLDAIERAKTNSNQDSSSEKRD